MLKEELLPKTTSLLELDGQLELNSTNMPQIVLYHFHWLLEEMSTLPVEISIQMV